MKNLVQFFTILFAIASINAFANNHMPDNFESKSAIVKSAIEDQGVHVTQRGANRFTYQIECGTVLIERGLDQRGLPYVRQFFRLRGTHIFRELSLDPGAATDPTKILTSAEICNGLTPYAT